MQSFYGGKTGASFIIVKSFPSVADMVANFIKGPGYTAVHYDEHVLINTSNKLDLENGNVYRRGHDYTNSMGGAVYIGNIAGPQGNAPILDVTSVDTVKMKKLLNQNIGKYSEGSYVVPADLVPGKDGSTFL